MPFKFSVGTMMRPGLLLRNMYKKRRSLVFFKLIIKFAAFKTCAVLPAVRIDCRVKLRTQLRLIPL